jgi:glutathione-regulated potassium-efflux system protein KefB
LSATFHRYASWRARNRAHVYKLMDLGVTDIYRETFASSLEAAEDLLTLVGLPAQEAEKARRTFRLHDEERLLVQHDFHHDQAQVAAQSREWLNELERMFEQDVEDEKADAARKAASI